MTRPAALVLLLLAVATVGCVPDTSPDGEACAQRAVELEPTLTAETLEPAALSVCRDQEVTVVVTSEVDGLLHIHGYDDEAPAFEVASGQVTEITFNAGRSGQFPIEFHPEDDPRGVAVGVFIVHEP